MTSQHPTRADAAGTAYAIRRPTTDVDIAARDTPGQTAQIRDLIASIAEQSADDGITFDTSTVTAEQIRDTDQYSGVRVSLTARLATAVIRFHVDVNVGDPIWPQPERIHLPRLLGGHITVRGYPLSMVLAEKIVTAIQRGTANTRWRDFVDVYLLTGAHRLSGHAVRTAITVVADHRGVTLRRLRDLHGRRYATSSQAKWSDWRRKQKLDAVLPEQFQEILDAVWDFSDPLLESGTASQVWDAPIRRWVPA